MNDDPKPPRHRIELPATCAVHGGAPGMATLVVTLTADGMIQFDPHNHGEHRCSLMISRAQADRLAAALRHWARQP